MNKHQTVKPLLSVCFKDSAAGARITRAYGCLHVTGRLTLHSETTDPDWFPGTPPELALVAEVERCAQSDRLGWLETAIDKRLAPLLALEGLHRCSDPVPAPECLDRLVRPSDRTLVAKSDFWSQMHKSLYSALPPKAETPEEVECWATLLERAQVKPMLAHCIAWLFAFPAMSRPEGLADAAAQAYQQPDAMVSEILPDVRAGVRYSIRVAQAATHAPLAFDEADFLQSCSRFVLQSFETHSAKGL